MNSVVQNGVIVILTNNNDILLLLIRYMARDGLDKKEIIKRLGITSQKFTALINKDSSICDELIYQKMITDYKVEDAVLKKALGGTVTEVKETEKYTGTETVTVTKEVPADTSALQFWLKNKCPDKWSDKGSDFSDTQEKLDKIFLSINAMADSYDNDLHESEEIK